MDVVSRVLEGGADKKIQASLQKVGQTPSFADLQGHAFKGFKVLVLKRRAASL